MLRTLLVIPCFNEAARLRRDAFESFAAGQPDVGFVFVDDGSSDGTGSLLADMAATFEDASDPWCIDEVDGSLIAELLPAIVGFSFVAAAPRGRFKLSQNRSPVDRARVEARLDTSPRERDREVARWMARLRS